MDDNRKWAYIEIDGERQMAAVDNKNGKAYKVNGYEWTWDEIINFKFIRWCTTFDL